MHTYLMLHTLHIIINIITLIDFDFDFDHLSMTVICLLIEYRPPARCDLVVTSHADYECSYSSYFFSSLCFCFCFCSCFCLCLYPCSCSCFSAHITSEPQFLIRLDCSILQEELLTSANECRYHQSYPASCVTAEKHMVIGFRALIRDCLGGNGA